VDERLGILRVTIKSNSDIALLLLLIGLTMSGTAYSQVPQSEREALIALYYATSGANWTNKTGWNGIAGTECDWYGVTCTGGDLTELRLSSNNLVGTIPSGLGNLTTLERLSFYDNSLTGTIPVELGNLTNLTYFSLTSNQLSGSIPSELGNLTSVTYFALAINQLTGSIPAELGNLTSVAYLTLGANQLSGSIPTVFGNLSSLKYLMLYGNALTGSIPSELGNLTNLIYLNLYDNQLSGSIPKELGSLSNLTTLSLYDNALTGLLRSELGNLTALTDLRLDNNQLSGSIPAAFSTIPTINVSSNPKLDRNVLIKLYDSTNGDNWTNKTGWNGAVGSECDWYGVSCHYPSIGSSSPYYQHQTIESLRLTSNNLSGTIPTEIGNLCDAERVLLGSSACTQLLSFYDNSLTGTIPAELGNLTTLTVLSLTSNQLSGTIPSSLGNLTSLTYLALAINQLTGSIPAELGNLTSVAYLTLGTNQLSGSIPTVLGNLSSLKYLFLYSNALTGSIPSELGDLTSLINFRLDGNKLSGVIPTQLSNLTALTELRLDHNKLVGPMPQWLSDMAISTLNVTDAFISAPIVAISGGSRTIEDTDGIAGESVSFTGTATDSDGTIATIQWLVDGSEVAAGLTPSIALPNGSTVVTFKATDDDGASSTTTATITVASPAYEPTEEWPSPYNGVTPDSSLGLAFNNIGSYDAAGSTIYTCLRVFTGGLPVSVGGIGEFDIGLTVVSLDEGTVQITKFREFNVIGALNENVELPDCSGKFETTTAVFTDTIETKLYMNLLGNLLPVIKTFETTFNLIDPTNLILKLDSFKELTAN